MAQRQLQVIIKKNVLSVAFTKRNNFFLKISSFCFVNSKNVFTFVHSSKFMDYGL